MLALVHVMVRLCSEKGCSKHHNKTELRACTPLPGCEMHACEVGTIHHIPAHPGLDNAWMLRIDCLVHQSCIILIDY